MPAGKTHEKINWIFLHSLCFIMLHIGSYILFGWKGVLLSFLYISGYLVGTYYLGPDLDLPSRPYYRWKALRFLWKPYQKWFSHRSFWTHSYVISDIIRMFYLTTWFCLPCVVLAFFLPNEWATLRFWVCEYMQMHVTEIGLFLLGIMTASSLHIAADQLSTARKKRNKRKKRNA